MVTDDVFGPNAMVIQEVIDFAGGRRILSQPFQEEGFEDFEVRVVHSLDEVLRFRHGQNLSNPERWSTAEKWFDIKETDMCSFQDASKAIPSYWDRIHHSISDASYEIQNSLVEQLGSVLPSREIDNIADDFEMIMAFRAVFGHNDCFHEKLYRVYYAYGYPCGWIGPYPEGKLIVYSRSAPPLSPGGRTLFNPTSSAPG